MRIAKFAFFSIIFSVISVHYPSVLINSADAKVYKSRAAGKTKKQSLQNVGPGNVWDRIRSGIRIPVPNPAAGIETIVSSPHPGNAAPLVSSVRIKSLTPDAKRSESAGTDVVNKTDDKISNAAGQTRIRQILMPRKTEADSSALTTDSDAKYTKLGQSLLGSKKPANQLSSRLTKKVPLSETEKLATAQSDRLFKSSIGRIRTRLGLHSDLTKATAGKEQKADKTSLANMSGQTLKSNVIKTAQIGGCSDLRKSNVIQLAKDGVLTEAYARMAQHCRDKQAMINERIAKQVAAYSRGFLHDVSERARPYLYHIVDTLSKHSLPLDLALLPIMESAYKSTALSSANASGLWQFIPSTGRLYGLEQNAGYDARRDVTASTQAAVRFLSSLNSHYKGDWLLALAAYNWGPGNVDAAIARNAEQGLDTDYWSLEMPAETQNYVPRLLALARIFANPGGFGLALRPLKNEPYFIKVTVDRENDLNQLIHKDLSEVAKLANFQADVFNQLNSAYLNPKLTERKSYQFLMPISNANVLHRSLTFLADSSSNDSRVLPFPHAWALSSRSDSSVFEMPLLALNWTADRQKEFISAGLSPEIPVKTKDRTNEEKMVVHYLDKGETLKSLAEYHGVSEEKLRQVNNVKRKQSVSLGQRLLIPLQLTGLHLKNTTGNSILYKKI